jgi:flagellar M-ring protein FliF
MKQINDLVREAMGFNKERGDTISVANAPFTAVDRSENAIPIWKDPENISYIKDLIKYLIIAAIVALLYFKVIQPSLKTMFPPPAKAEDGTATEGAGGIFGGTHVIAGEEGEEGATDVRIDHYAIKVQKARDIAQADPKAVANIIKDWIGANGG